MTNEQVKNTYIKYLTKLNRATKNGIKTPHKPILLLSILQLIRKGEITTNRIFITPELVLAFKSNWNALVTSNNICTFALPFYHLKSEPFWHLTYLRSGAGALKSISTLKSLNDNIAFAEIDQLLFHLMTDAFTNTLLENILVENYFPSTKASYFKETSEVQYTLELEIKNQMVNDTREEYQTKMQSLEEVLTDEEIQEERFIRGGIFKKEIPRIYNHQCCISGMKIQTTINAQMVDACHIIPFSMSNDDTISNGICLSPNLHRAFDRGLLTINEDYIVRISPSVNESNSPYGIIQFAGKQIDLPKEVKLYPSTQNLSWHRKECFVF
jgi:putative restriction endonuclease